jgi:hypothetical protein
VSRRTLLPLVLGSLLLTGCAGKPPASSASDSTDDSSTSSATSASSSPNEQRLEVEIAGGQVSGDTGRVPVAEGTHVTLVVTRDVADEVHVHGYDVESELEPGTPAELSFDATVPGVFEVELHESGTVLLTLQVA